jgi:NAD(P)-dependent dehydrogenase (short-subunit alcohol dehydrogenase family)
MDLGLEQKVVLVTGGSSGIGRGTAARLAAEGARVAICARGEDRLASAAQALRDEYGAEVLAVPADVGTAAGVERFVGAALDRFGTIHGLVNNAGGSAAGPFESVTDADWQADLDLKLFSMIRMTRHCLPHLIENHGAVVNIAAIGGQQPGARSTPSTVTRAAGLALTKALSKEYAPQGVRVNAICIGVVRSGQQEKHWQQHAPHLALEEFYVEWARQRGVPLGRVGDPEEVAALIALLLSDRGAFITGTAINVDGGMSAVL